MDLLDVTHIIQDDVPIKGLWIGTRFVWPDPWTDIWQEGVTVYWDNVWRNQWSPTPPALDGTEPNNG